MPLLVSCIFYNNHSYNITMKLIPWGYLLLPCGAKDMQNWKPFSFSATYGLSEIIYSTAFFAKSLPLQVC